MVGGYGPSRAGLVIAAVAILAASIACAAMEPALADLIAATPTAGPGQAWAVVDLPKPTQTPGMPPASPTPSAIEATSEPPAAESPTSEAAPLITMVIVSEDEVPAASENQAPAAS